MANIFLTKKCNLKCPYCFADEFVNKDNQEISIENFKKALNFIKTNPLERIGLIGGEPTIYSNFHEILQIINNDKEINQVIVYTNGIEIDKYIESLENEKFNLLINCNCEKDIGKTNFDKLKNNISILKKFKKNKFDIGINLYSKELDYTFIYELLELAELKRLRFSISIPNDSKEKTIDVINGFKDFKPFLFQFFNECLEKNILPYNDCNSLPNCILTTEDMKILLKIDNLGKKYNYKDTIIRSMNTCKPVIDILPDLTSVRCFGLSKYEKVPISNFKNIESLRKYFFNKIDIYARITKISNNCNSCNYDYLEKCGYCLTYKLKKMNENIEKLTT